MPYDDIREIVMSDPETGHLNLNDNDLYTVYQYLLMRDSNSMPGYIPKLVFEPYLHIEYMPTKAKRDEELNRELRRRLQIFESDVYIQDASFDDFETHGSKTYEDALKYAQHLVFRSPNFYEKGMYLYGPYGAGKSYLLSALAKELTKKRVNVIFTFVPDLVRALKTSMATDTLESKINMLKRSDVLILDDLGGEYLSVWFRDEVLLPVLHYRLNAKLPVLISSNLSPLKLAQAIASENEDEMKSSRILKRIQDLTTPFKLDTRFGK